MCNWTGWVSKRVQVGHPEFGKTFPCQCAQVDPGKLQRYSELPFQDRPHNWDNLTPRAEVQGLETALQAAHDFASGNTENKILTIYGANGLGKSHLLEAVGWDMLSQGYAVKFTAVSDMLDHLRGTYDDETPESLSQALERYKNADVLLLDDIKIERVTDFAREQLTKLVDLRYRYGGYLVVTTKFSADEIGGKWTSHLADRLFDENSGVVRVCPLRGPSYRTGRNWR